MRGKMTLPAPTLKSHEVRSRPEVAILLLLLALAALNAAELKPETLRAWDAYVSTARMRMKQRATGQAAFLWVDEQRDLAERVRAGEVVAEPVNGDSPHSIPHGLIHDWLGAMFVPQAKLEEVMSVLADYEHYQDFYRPMVVKASVLAQTPEHQKVTLLMMQKAFSVVGAVETANEVQTARLGSNRAYTLSTSVRVQEIADFGKPDEHLLPQDHGPGYVWRTFNVTRAQERDSGVYIEMEMVVMSRSIPLEFRWLVKPLAERLPRGVLVTTLRDRRDAVNQETRAALLKKQTTAQVMRRR